MNDELTVTRGPVAIGREDEISIEHSRDSTFIGRGRMHTKIFLSPPFARVLAKLILKACDSSEPATYGVELRSGKGAAPGEEGPHRA